MGMGKNSKNSSRNPRFRRKRLARLSRSKSWELEVNVTEAKRRRGLDTPECSNKNSQEQEHQEDQHINFPLDSKCPKQDLCDAQSQNTNPVMEEPEVKIDIDKEYTPEEWSTKYSTPEEVLQRYLGFITGGSVIATNTIPNELDVVYSSFNGQKLDIFGVDLPDDAPILVYLHGGYWKDISKDISRFPAVTLHKSGVKTIIVGHDQRPKATLSEITDQVEDAILYVLNYAQNKGSRGVFLAGHCGGAHLIAKVLGNYELFNCAVIKALRGVFLISGIYDLRNFCLTTANYSIDLLKTDAVSLSPLFHKYTHLENSNIRFYIMAGEEDSPTFKSQSREFFNLLLDYCPINNICFEIKNDMDHFDMVKCFAKEINYLNNLILHDLADDV